MVNEDFMSTQPNLITPPERPHSVREAPVSQQYAARFLNMHPKTVLRKARQGSLPAHPVGAIASGGTFISQSWTIGFGLR